MPVTSQKRPVFSPLDAEACESTASIGCISLPRTRPPPPTNNEVMLHSIRWHQKGGWEKMSHPPTLPFVLRAKEGMSHTHIETDESTATQSALFSDFSLQLTNHAMQPIQKTYFPHVWCQCNSSHGENNIEFRVPLLPCMLSNFSNIKIQARFRSIELQFDW